MIKRYLPKSLLGRALMIIVTPLVLLQIISAVIFYETHWDRVSYRLAKSVAGDLAAIVAMIGENADPAMRQKVFQLAATHMDMRLSLNEGAVLEETSDEPARGLARLLYHAVDSDVRLPFMIDVNSLDQDVIIDLQVTGGVLHALVARKRLFSSTVYVFVLWMVGSSMILFGVATIFMRNQVRPIRRLAIAADSFGKGREVPQFKPEGAREVRQAASAFAAMQARIKRQIRQRTDMLSGVSHDLRTPLTRMKLQLAMLKGVDGVGELEGDIIEMERMLEGYLAFARGEGTEKPIETDLNALLTDAVGQARRKGRAIDLHIEDKLNISLRPNAFKRCISNLVENAGRYADHIAVRAENRNDAIELVIDDDGPGIPADKRDEVFRPFFRIDQSRNPETGGVGLGLTIARDVIRGHGGEIDLSDAPGGGLRVLIRLPH